MKGRETYHAHTDEEEDGAGETHDHGEQCDLTHENRYYYPAQETNPRGTYHRMRHPHRLCLRRMWIDVPL